MSRMRAKDTWNMVELIPVYSKLHVQKAIVEVADQINIDGFIAPAMLIVVLNGGAYFFDKIKKFIKTDFQTDFIQAKSYHGTRSNGNINILKDLSGNIDGKDCLVIDDILDSGATSFYLNKLLEKRNPARIRYAYLVVRKNATKYNVAIDYQAFNLKGDDFIVGCGMDLDGSYRELDGIYKISNYETVTQ